MSIIEAVREYILMFPELPDRCVLIDYLGAEPEQYTLEPVPCDPVFRQYTDGGALKQFLFLFASREIYCADVAKCAEIQAFYESFSRWIQEQNIASILPVLEAGKEAVDIAILTNSYAFSENADTARYQIQLRLIYKEE